MSLQFNCPYCQLLMTADPRMTGGQVQCPSCHQLFVVGGVVQAMPVVQARNVPTQPAAPQKPSAPTKPVAPQPQRPGPPQPQRPGAPRGSTTPRAAAKPKSAGEGMAVAMIAGVLVLGVGLLYGAITFVSNMQKKADASLFDLPPDVKALEVARAAQAKKEKLAEQAAEAASKTAVETATEAYFALTVTDGNTKVAHELRIELEAVEQELDTLRTDADASNDPKDVRAFYRKGLEKRVAANNVIRNWLGGKSPALVTAAIWGDGDSARRPRGQVADFLMAGDYASSGTGFFVSAAGWLLTNQHVVKDAKEVDIRDAEGVIRKARVVKVDADADVALLKAVETPRHWLHIAPNEVPMGSDVCTIGYPNATIQGVEPKFTTGTVSSLSGIRDDHDNYQITVPLQPGNSGGPLVEIKSGNVVGIVAAGLRDRESQNVNYAIKGGVVQRVLATVTDAASAVTQPASDSNGSDTVTLAANVKSAIVMVLVK